MRLMTGKTAALALATAATASFLGTASAADAADAAVTDFLLNGNRPEHDTSCPAARD
ncbi:hypothetical protein ABZS71_29935 [Streptomyces sp. NPDC005393]|uniref:hypothetical protein n=1 Tax=Streptomyces sp. NPDC005393 TaxID=3157041 RepID=UPI0033BEB7AD